MTAFSSDKELRLAKTKADSALSILILNAEGRGRDPGPASWGKCINMVGKIYTPEDYCWLSRFRKRESAKYRMLGSSVIHIIPRECSENSARELNKENEIGRSLTVFHEPRRRMTRVKQRES